MAASTLAAPAIIGTARAGVANLMVVYVSADDCAPCRQFEASDWPNWQASALSRSVKFVKTNAPKTTQAFQSRYWPTETRPFLSSVKVPVVPSFILTNNGGLVLVGSGLVGWRNQVVPGIHRLRAAGGPQS